MYGNSKHTNVFTWNKPMQRYVPGKHHWVLTLVLGGHLLVLMDPMEVVKKRPK